MKHTKGIDLFTEVRKRARKAGKAPGSLTFTGEESNAKPIVSIIQYDKEKIHELVTDYLPDDIQPQSDGVTWINLEGLHDIELIKKIAKQFDLHPLTVEDILNVAQRPKVDEYKNYLFITLKSLSIENKTTNFIVKQSSLVVGPNFVLSFQEQDTSLFEKIAERLKKTANQRLRTAGSDYLAYRMIDEIVDQYFVVLESLSDQIEIVEETIIDSPSPQIPRGIYRLKRQMLLLRKAIWPMREAIGHLLHEDEAIICSETRIYLRDVYDHTIQAMDTLETFRDILSSMLDMYLSSLTIRMNEIMKTLTIITTIFIPITAIASIYGMNFHYIPGLGWHPGFWAALSVMGSIGVIMLIYFKHKKWI